MASFDIEQIVAAVRAGAGKADYLPLHEPEFGGNEKAYLLECIDSTFVSSVGQFVSRFESMLASRIGVRHAVACVNGTAALQVCLQAVGVRRDEEVIVPSLTFIATANSISYVGATPHFVDCDPLTLGLDPERLAERLQTIGERSSGGIRNAKTGRRIAAIVPMHTFGHPAKIDGILKVAGDWGLPVVEDAAESLGTSYRGKAAGTFGRVAALSFNGNKIVTTGGGGAILTDDDELARHVKHLTTTAKIPHRWAFDHDEVGYNYRMPNLNAALGCAQLEQLEGFIERKRRIAKHYQQALAGLPGIRFVVEPEHARSNYWLNTLLIDPEFADQRDPLLDALNEAGLMARPAWKLMHRLRMYASCPHGLLDVSEDLEARIVNIPSSATLMPKAAG
ncbi:MAG: LegC family aminotransferase [Rhizobiales bacterium]|nr:LegC family aminotransferase [Hyphomicrobiales bacterium]OJY43008.1 MAG: aminotransferase DegT [Rhizobiales bacterium 64-17]